MDTGEIVALLIVVLVLVIGSLVIGVRCCRSACSLVRDEAAQRGGKFSVTEGLRRSIRRMSFRRRGNSFRGRPQQEPVAKVATIADLHKERSELHPKYRPKSGTEREEGDGAVDEDGSAAAAITATVSDCTVHFAREDEAAKVRVADIPGPVGTRMEHERMVCSDASAAASFVTIDNLTGNDSSTTDAIPTIRHQNDDDDDDPNPFQSVSCHQIDFNLLDGFSNPGFETGSTLELVANEEGGFENPGYLVMETPEPVRSGPPANPKKTTVEERSSIESTHSKTIEEDFKDIQIQSKYLIDLGGGETDVGRNTAAAAVRVSPPPPSSNTTKGGGVGAASDGVVLGVRSPFSRHTPNRASIGALKSRPGKLSEENIKRVTTEQQADPEEKEEDDSTVVARYYQPPPKNAMYPERSAEDADDDEDDDAKEAPTFVHACYELTGAGVRLPDSDTLTSDSFI